MATLSPRIDHTTPPIQSIQSVLAIAGLLRPYRHAVLPNLLGAASRVRFDTAQKTDARDLGRIERLRQEAEATFDLHDSMERWMRGDDPVFGSPSERWKALHPQMNYHLQRIRHREQHELWGSPRLPACKEKERATIAFLNSGGDAEEMRWWPEGLEEEFLNSLIWQWKSDTGL